MKRSTTVLAGALLAAAVLAGCGDDSKSGSSSGDYCAKIQAYKDKSDELDAVFTDAPDSAAVENAFTTMQTMINDLKSDAPSEIKDDVISTSHMPKKSLVVSAMALKRVSWLLAAIGRSF